jgi:ABC-type phosphate/phosphonate transport system substrate-binding protein
VGPARGVTGEGPIAVLPMYDFAWVTAANDRLWAAISAGLAEAGVQAPLRLSRGGELAAQWRNPKLVFAQTCGYPHMTQLRDAVAMIATPEYGFPGCEGASHRSFIIAKADESRRKLREFRGRAAALNAWDSNTGMNLFRAAIAPVAGGAPFFRATVVTGSHEASVEAVAECRADLASIDCVSFAHLKRGRPELIERVAIVAKSALSPGLPFIASARLGRRTVEAAREALFAALADPDLAEARATLGLVGACAAKPANYDRVAGFERGAAALGYPHLA